MKVEPLSEAEVAWVEERLALARSWIGLAPGGEITAAQLDDLAEAVALQLEDRDPNPVIAVLGVAFGDVLRRRTGLAWQIVTDEHGTDLALHGNPGDVVIAPTNLVAKRWTRGEYRFMAAIEPVLVANVKSVRGATRS